MEKMDSHLDTILTDHQHGKAKMKSGLTDTGKESIILRVFAIDKRLSLATSLNILFTKD